MISPLGQTSVLKTQTSEAKFVLFFLKCQINPPDVAKSLSPAISQETNSAKTYKTIHKQHNVLKYKETIKCTREREKRIETWVLKIFEEDETKHQTCISISILILQHTN